MALIKCPECGKEISSTAKTCINCGCNLIINNSETTKEVKTVKPPILIASLVFSIIGLAHFFLLALFFDNQYQLDSSLSQIFDYTADTFRDFIIYVLPDILTFIGIACSLVGIVLLTIYLKADKYKVTYR